MSLIIQTNIESLSLNRHMSQTLKNMFSSLEKLSSAVRINRAADGPADLIISERFRTQIATLNQQIDNTGNLIEKYSYASSSVGQIRSQLTELRTLAVGASNVGFNDESAQEAYQMAANGIVDSVNKMIGESEYNGYKLFDDSLNALAPITSLEGVDFSSAEAVESAITQIDAKINEVDRAQVELGSTQRNELEAQKRSMEISRENLIAAESTIRSTDMALEMSRFISESMKYKTSIAMLSHQFIQADMVLGLLGS